MRAVLLLGAGFSRNWGGWLAAEAFEYLLGCPEIMGDEGLRRLLWKHQPGESFEGALAELQVSYLRDPRGHEALLMSFQSAVRRMFEDMNRGFFEIQDFEPQNHVEMMVRRFLVRFDAIFTLNQDVLIEQHYINNDVALMGNHEWAGATLPGMRRIPSPEAIWSASWSRASWVPLSPADFRIDEGFQPFVKLHGSSNWSDPDGRPLLVMGGAKTAAINQQPVLQWYARLFDEYLAIPDTRLMVIGYGFRDQHINASIKQAVERGLRIFIMAPEGPEIAQRMNPTRNRAIGVESELEQWLQPALIGASRRPMRDIFGSDIAEHKKVMRFFD